VFGGGCKRHEQALTDWSTFGQLCEFSKIIHAATAVASRAELRPAIEEGELTISFVAKLWPL
jgi:hypothetical protein